MAKAFRPGAILSIGDDPADSDDTRRRKHVSILAAVVTVFVPLLLPIQAPALSLAWPLAIALSAFSLGNLAFYARTRVFDRFVAGLLIAGVWFVPAANFVGGGITGPTTGLVWAFMIPAYAILAVGPSRAVRWYIVYLVVVAVQVALDPVARSTTKPPSYALVILGQVQNTVVPLTVTFLLYRYSDVRRIEAEARVEQLLTNAIPPVIADRLRRGERRIAELYPATSVLFADIVDFTPYAQRTPPDEVVALLDGLFTEFDELADHHGVEKIKTIGDAYMAVAGAPEERADHAAAAVALGLDIIDVVARTRARGGVPIAVRVGIASGPAVGGVIGQRRFVFDLWGDTVNTAQRLEASGVPGRVQISAATLAGLSRGISVESRVVEAKGLGRITAYLVGERPATE